MASSDKILVIFSGGQDSTVCLLKAIHDYGRDQVVALSFVYGQRHSIELEAAKKMAATLRVSHKIIFLNTLAELSDNALTNSEKSIQSGENGSYPNTFVPGRNALFLLYAAIYGDTIGARRLVIGVSEADFSGYPDCRADFIFSMEETLSLALGKKIIIEAPLQYLNTAEIWGLADALGALDWVEENSHTCYLGVKGGCHECPACHLREEGLKRYRALQQES